MVFCILLVLVLCCIIRFIRLTNMFVLNSLLPFVQV